MVFIKGHTVWNKGILCSKETKEKISLSKRGKKLSDEHKKKLSIIMIGNKIGVGHKNHFGKKHTIETKIKMSKSKIGKYIGEKNWKWIKDRTKLAVLHNGEEYRNSPAHREWSRLVKNRDGWKCRISNDDCSGKVVSHHILSWREYPELRYEVNNGITLCHAHHPRKRNDEKKFAIFFNQLVADKA